VRGPQIERFIAQIERFVASEGTFTPDAVINFRYALVGN
jgi:hypothetical protein